MPAPILKVGPLLIVSLVEALTDAELEVLRGDLADRVGRVRARAVVIDVSSLDVLDSFASRTLLEMAHVAALRGARSFIVGVQPEVAIAMVQLGLTLEGVETALDVDDALDALGFAWGTPDGA